MDLVITIHAALTPSEILAAAIPLKEMTDNLGKFEIIAEELVCHLVATKFGSQIQAINPATTNHKRMHHVMQLIHAHQDTQPTPTLAHAAVASTKHVYVKGTTLNKSDGSYTCKVCHKVVTNPQTHNATNCTQRKSAPTPPQGLLPSAGGRGRGKGGRGSGAGGLTPQQQMQQMQQQLHALQQRHAHYAQSINASGVQPGMAAYPLVFPQQFANAQSQLSPAASGPHMAEPQAQWAPQPGQFVNPPVHVSFTALNTTGQTRILDSGASITTIGSHIPLFNSTRSNILLRTTQGCTSNVLQGFCKLVFADQHGQPALIQLPAISSPDFQPDIVLISYHQLLTLGYTFS